MTIDNPKHRHGLPCHKCGGTLRYKSNKNCVPCSLSRIAASHVNNAEKRKAYKRKYRQLHRPAAKREYLKLTYNMTLEQYNALSDTQEGKCAICGTSPKRLVVDHCHTQGHVRGLLCDNCNTAIGLLKDSSEHLRQAAAYLDQTQTRNDAT